MLKWRQVYDQIVESGAQTARSFLDQLLRVFALPDGSAQASRICAELLIPVSELRNLKREANAKTRLLQLQVICRLFCVHHKPGKAPRAELREAVERLALLMDVNKPAALTDAEATSSFHEFVQNLLMMRLATHMPQEMAFLRRAFELEEPTSAVQNEKPSFLSPIKLLTPSKSPLAINSDIRRDNNNDVLRELNVKKMLTRTRSTDINFREMVLPAVERAQRKRRRADDSGIQAAVKQRSLTRTPQKMTPVRPQSTNDPLSRTNISSVRSTNVQAHFHPGGRQGKPMVASPVVLRTPERPQQSRVCRRSRVLVESSPPLRQPVRHRLVRSFPKQ